MSTVTSGNPAADRIAGGGSEYLPPIGEVAAQLRRLLVAAGLPALSAAPDEGDPAGTITLPPLSGKGATVLAELMQCCLADYFAVARELAAAFAFHGVRVPVDVVGQRLSLGAVSVAEADGIARALGAPRLGDGDGADYRCASTARLVADRLADRVGAVVGPRYVPVCAPDDAGVPTVALGELGLESAELLLRALQPGSTL